MYGPPFCVLLWGDQVLPQEKPQEKDTRVDRRQEWVECFSHCIITVPAGEAKQSRVNSLGLASMHRAVGLVLWLSASWTWEDESGSVFPLEERWPDRKYGFGLLSLHGKSMFPVWPFAFSKNWLSPIQKGFLRSQNIIICRKLKIATIHLQSLN